MTAFTEVTVIFIICLTDTQVDTGGMEVKIQAVARRVQYLLHPFTDQGCIWDIQVTLASYITLHNI
jgi:hypothetical protein